MTRLPFRPWLLVLLAAPLTLAAATARAQDLPPIPFPPPAPPAQPAPPAPLAPETAPPAFPQPVQPAYPQPYPQPYTQPVGPGRGPFSAAPGEPTPYAYGPPPGYVQPTPDRDRAIPGNWYGWQTLIAIAPADIAMFTGLARFSDPGGKGAFAAGFVARSIAPGIVHMAHGRVGTGFGSIGLHLATTATGFAIGYGIGIGVGNTCTHRGAGCDNNLRDIPDGVIYGAVAGNMVGTVLDVIFFAHRQRLSWTAEAPVAPASPTWAVAPYATQRTGGLAATGMF